MRNLLVGLDSKLVKESVTWSEVESKVPTFGEYDNVIIYLPTLEYVLGRMYSTTIEKINEQISKAIYRTDTTFYCITAPEFEGQNKEITNYSIFPFRLKVLNDESGTILKPKPNNSYFAKVKSWDFCFSGLTHREISDLDSIQTLAWNLNEIAKTQHLEHVAFSISLVQKYKSTGQIAKELKRPVYFLPPLSSDGHEEIINALLSSYILPEQYVIPEFVKQIEIPGDKEIQSKIVDLEKVIKDATHNLKQEKEQQAKRDFLKGIVALKEKPLVRAVVGVLKEMGITLEGKDTHDEDKTFVLGENRIPVEIKGHKGAVGRADILQIMSRIEKAKVEKEEYAKGILIANPYNETPLEKRGIDFEPNIVKGVDGWNICLISTDTLLKFWISYKQTGKTDLAERILKTTGVLTF